MICCWCPEKFEKVCQDEATHFHHAAGEICAHHAAKLMAKGEKLTRLRRHNAGLKSKETLKTNQAKELP